MTAAMLAELTEIENRFGDKAVDEVRRAANILLRRQFLFAGDRRSTHAYEILTSGRFRSYFIGLFDALGYTFSRSDHEQWVGLLPDPALDIFPKMRTEHTIVLLVLALTWQEEVNRGGAGARAVVTTTLNTLYERYRDVVARSRKEALNTARLEEALRDFERRSLVRLEDFDPDEQDREVDIRPMIHLLVDGNALDRLERFAAEAEARRAETNIFQVVQLHEQSLFTPEMPAWNELVLSWDELRVIPESWKAKLREWRGIYLIYDVEIKPGYVGSASGTDNLLGRWQNYAATGHGGNVGLRRREPVNFRFSILERLSPDMQTDEICVLENLWKVRLSALIPNRRDRISGPYAPLFSPSAGAHQGGRTRSRHNRYRIDTHVLAR